MNSFTKRQIITDFLPNWIYSDELNTEIKKFQSHFKFLIFLPNIGTDKYQRTKWRVGDQKLNEK